MPDTTTDPAAAHLGYLRACVEAAQVTPEAFDLGVLMPNLGRALVALDEALKHHQPLIRPSFKPKCSECTDEQGYRALWPCPEYQAISRALLGEGSSDG